MQAWRSATYAGRLPPSEHSTLQNTSSPRQTAPKSIGAAHVAQNAGVTAPADSTLSNEREPVGLASPRLSAIRSALPDSLPAGSWTMPIPIPSLTTRYRV
jgi:hypothetical protein